MPFQFGQIKNEVNSEQNLLDRLEQWLSCNYSNDLDATTIASALNIHRSWLHRKLKEATGQSLSEYVTIFRLERARSLRASSLSLKEIAFAVGFNDYVHFMRSYKKHHGHAPSEFFKKN